MAVLVTEVLPSKWAMSQPSESDETALAAVFAHGLLNSLAVATGAVSTLRRYDDALSADERGRLLDQANEHLNLAVALLEDIVRGLPPEVRDVLDHPPGRQP